MKTSLRKLRWFALNRHGGGGDLKDRRDLRPLAQFDELAKATQDMEDMRDCYDSLLSAAAATANSAYEFSESLREMGACLLEKTALNDNEESGKALLMIGKVQYELQKLVESYRSHIFQTITVPSECLLNELRIVEEMKRQCDEKREAFEYMVMQHEEKGRGRSGKGDGSSMQQLHAAHDEYDEEATLFVFRLKSLKQGQSRSLLTQAARHHAAQLAFFKKSLKSLEAIEPYVKKVTEQQHIDYHFSELEEEFLDDANDGDDDDYTFDGRDDGELSFDYGQIDQDEEVSTSQNLMEVDKVDITFSRVDTLETPKETLDRNCRKSFSLRRQIRNISQSAPLFPEIKLDPAEKIREMQPSLIRKYDTYVLPTPDDTRGSKSSESGNPISTKHNSSLSGSNRSLWHSSPLDPKMLEKLSGRENKPPESDVKNVKSIPSEGKNVSKLSRLPLPLADRILSSRPDPLAVSDSKKLKRHAFSGPISPKPWPTTSVPSHPQLFSGPILRNPMVHSSPRVSPKASPKVCPSASPPLMSTPKINELHELPLPPRSSYAKSPRPSGLVGHSSPLVPKGHMLPATSVSPMSSTASPQPRPSQVVTRSFSIHSSGIRAMALNVSKPPEINNK